MFSQFRSILSENEPLAPLCWLKLGGDARYFAKPTSTEQVAELCKEAHTAGLPVRLLGGGSNVLIRAGTLEALVLQPTDGFNSIQTDGSRILVGAATPLSELLSSAAEAGLAGLEHLAGIPGTVGGAVVCNSAVSNGDIGSRVKRVWAVSPEGAEQELDSGDLKFAFRQSNLDGRIVTQIELELEAGDAEEVTRRLQSCWIVRRAAQPPAGSPAAQAFVEPASYSITQLLEAAGMRNASEGEAGMNPQYPGFLMVNDKATAEDVLSLTSKIARAVEVQSGIQLQSQLKIW